ncbi:hypothetical protein BAU15_10710 [Enterococcus sp. JM4C]|uniref:DUF2255 family protein n=1 Tax=Candidatus Enterococcus huntleyi TaxID=1857217 RepID=UPI00137AAC75|nr:DUF2255 family protein [Enterococcus sp. JM4C]KAF1298593.1 hypothetical protein BAU15_10710 [Enterococcus sp. JM4C]
MTKWLNEELEAIGNDENLYLSIPNPDGNMHAPAWIWIAEADGRLFARGYSGQSARWYQSAKREGRGHLSVGGIEKEVHIRIVQDESLNEAIDKGYEKKYAGSAYLAHMIGQLAKSATVEFIPIDDSVE